jgi:hypothetical protein
MSTPRCKADGEINVDPPPWWRGPGMLFASCLVTRSGEIRDCRVFGDGADALGPQMREWLYSQSCKPSMLRVKPLDVCYLFTLPPRG